MSSGNIENETFYVQTRPLIQYGPLSLKQLKELYTHDIIDDNSFIASSTKKQKKTGTNNGSNPFRLMPNEKPTWIPVRLIDDVHTELIDAMSTYNKNDHTSSTTNKGSNNIQINMNVNGNVPSTMDINMNITNNKKDVNKQNLPKNNIIYRELNELRIRNKLQNEKIQNLIRIKKNLQKQVTTLTAKYNSQYIDLKTKMIKKLDEYKNERNKSQILLKNEIELLKNKLKNNNNNNNNNNNDNYIKEINKLKEKQDKLMDQIKNIQINTIYYKARYKALQGKHDLEAFNTDKYNADLNSLKEQLLHKQSIIQHQNQLVDSLLKNTIMDVVPYSSSLNDIEGKIKNNSNSIPSSPHIQRSIIRLDAIKIGELLQWYNYLNKFHLSMDVLVEYELSSKRARSRMKNVVSMLGEKVKSLNIRNIQQKELIRLSIDLKQSYEKISSETHLKEYELSNNRRELLKNTSYQPRSQSHTMNINSPQPISLFKQISINDDHHHNISFGSMASLSMLDPVPGPYSRNLSLHSLSPSLDLNAENDNIAKHRKKSDTIKGSGLRLLTDQETLNQYLQPNTSNQDNNHDRQNSHSHSHSHSHNRHRSNRSLSSQKRNQKKKVAAAAAAASPVIKGKYAAFSAFKNKFGGSARTLHKKKTRKGSTSSNKSHSNLYSHHNYYKQNHHTYSRKSSISSISALSQTHELKLQYINSDEDFDVHNDNDNDNDDASTVIMKLSPKKNKQITFNKINTDYNNDNTIKKNNKTINNNNKKTQSNGKEQQISQDILSFFAM